VQSSQDLAPIALTITRGKVMKGAHGAKLVPLSGMLTIDGKPAPNVTISLSHAALSNGRLATLGKVTTDATGHWKKTVMLSKSMFVTAGATIASKPATCQASFGVPCALSTGGSMTVATQMLHLVR